MPRLNRSGKITMLRVHAVGTAFGPNTDKIDVEAVFQVEGVQGSFGFQLRNDANAVANRGMLDLLRDAFERSIPVTFDYDVPVGKSNGIAMRVWLKAPTGPVVGGLVSTTRAVVDPG